VVRLAHPGTAESFFIVALQARLGQLNAAAAAGVDGLEKCDQADRTIATRAHLSHPQQWVA
jgi:hypothetical protein